MLLTAGLLCCCFAVAEAARVAKAAATPHLVPLCTDSAGRFTQAAVACEDTAGSSYCSSFNPVHFYTPASPFLPARLGGDAKYRLTECYTGEDVTPATILPDPSYVFAAVATCPKTCGFCCMTPQFSCRNPANAPLNCELVTQAQCRDPKSREHIARYCPNKCGFCLEGNCVDAAVDCDKDSSICFSPELKSFAQKNCKRTCGYCEDSAATACGDTVSSCHDLVNKGFCASRDYTQDEKRRMCGRSCRLC